MQASEIKLSSKPFLYFVFVTGVFKLFPLKIFKLKINKPEIRNIPKHPKSQNTQCPKIPKTRIPKTKTTAQFNNQRLFHNYSIDIVIMILKIITPDYETNMPFQILSTNLIQDLVPTLQKLFIREFKLFGTRKLAVKLMAKTKLCSFYSGKYWQLKLKFAFFHQSGTENGNPNGGGYRNFVSQYWRFRILGGKPHFSEVKI